MCMIDISSSNNLWDHCDAVADHTRDHNACWDWRHKLEASCHENFTVDEKTADVNSVWRDDDRREEWERFMISVREF